MIVTPPGLLAEERLSELQQHIIHAPAQGEIVVGGVAGSGKTIAAVYRAAHLVECTPRRHNELPVLFLCYNRPLREAVQQLVAQLPSSISSRIIVRTIHRWCWTYVSHRLPNCSVISDEDRMELVREAIRETRYSSGAHEVFEFASQVFLDEIRLIKGCGLVERDEYIEKRLAHIGALTIEHYDLIFSVAESYGRLLRSHSQIDYDDFAPIALSAVMATRNSARNEHVIMDEAQDLSAVQIDLGRRIARQSLMLIADQAQTIYHVARLPDTLPPTETYDVMLTESFRTTAQIFTHAQRLLPDILMYEPLSRQGLVPEAHYFRWVEDEAVFIADTIASLLQSGIAPTEIAILVRQRNVLPPIIETLHTRGISVDDERESEQQGASVIVTTIHLSKGREFRAVFVAGMVEGVLPRIMPEMDRSAVGQELALARRQLYVAMTRASERLWLTGSEGRPSRFFNEIELPIEQSFEEDLWAS